MNAQECIRTLDLRPHAEGGFFRETWRAPTVGDERATGTAIYYLLEAGPGSHWHRVDATEIWHYYAGAPLELSLARNPESADTLVLGSDLALGQRPQIVIDAQVWQSARTLGEFTLVGCTVSPGFEFSGFVMADRGWAPSGQSS